MYSGASCTSSSSHRSSFRWRRGSPKGRAEPGEFVTGPLPYLSSFPGHFWWGCDWSSCGQGALAIFIIALVWLLFAVITPFSAWAAADKLHARRHPTRPGPIPARPSVGGFGVSAADLPEMIGFIGRPSRSRIRKRSALEAGVMMRVRRLVGVMIVPAYAVKRPRLSQEWPRRVWPLAKQRTRVLGLRRPYRGALRVEQPHGSY